MGLGDKACSSARSRTSSHFLSCPSESWGANVLLCPPQDLLALLQEHGPSTEGIFLLAAGERASRELREALDSGAQVQLESQPVHLLATIFQEFLRKIPSKLLQNELYQDWMSALQKTSRQERLAGLKEVASKLPKANFLLLKQLLSLLQKISRNVTTTRMTARKLAICLGPDLLSPPEEDMLPVEILVEVLKVCSVSSLLQPPGPTPALLFSGSWLPSLFSECWCGGCWEEQPHSCSFCSDAKFRSGKGGLTCFQPPGANQWFAVCR
ncbi:T-cell activation Rho GTPase-activating protein-like isoform X1 [Columba livia]|uniref:T-cell activation Rho GTPase-activating protein-like isoform X1 n=1 Tax=Columba livia TaxID=8932 RepID=UPI0031BAAEEF